MGDEQKTKIKERFSEWQAVPAPQRETIRERDTRIIADRESGRSALIGLGWDTDHGAKIDASQTAFNAGEGGLDSRQTVTDVGSDTHVTFSAGLGFRW